MSLVRTAIPVAALLVIPLTVSGFAPSLASDTASPPREREEVPGATPETSPPPSAPAAPAHVPGPAPRLDAFALHISGTERDEASFEEIIRKPTCALGGPDGRYRLAVMATPGEDGNEWSTIEIEALDGTGRRTVDRVYRLSGPCWAPDGSYFVYSTGSIVKAASPERGPAVIWQDERYPKGGIFPAEARNFKWGTAMTSLRFLVVEDPRRPEPRGELIQLHLAH